MSIQEHELISLLPALVGGREVVYEKQWQFARDLRNYAIDWDIRLPRYDGATIVKYLGMFEVKRDEQGQAYSDHVTACLIMGYESTDVNAVRLWIVSWILERDIDD